MAISRSQTGTGVFKSINGTTSTGDGIVKTFDTAYSNWAMQVVSGSCNAQVTLQGSLASSSDASFTTIITYLSSSAGGGDASGVTLFATSTPVATVKAVWDTNSSSGGLHAWIAGTP